MAKFDGIAVGKWSVGRDDVSGAAVIKLEWTDRRALGLIVPIDQAVALGKALCDLENRPRSIRLPN